MQFGNWFRNSESHNNKIIKIEIKKKKKSRKLREFAEKPMKRLNTLAPMAKIKK